MNNLIDCCICMLNIDDQVVIYKKDNNIQLVGIYLGNSKFTMETVAKVS